MTWLSCAGDPPQEEQPPLEPVCGDGQVAGDESCDDGNAWGGDGCDPACELEDGPFEEEPNDDVGQAQVVTLPATLSGNLPPADRDCFELTVPESGALTATWTSPDADGCAVDTFVELLDADGVRRTAGLPDLRTGCGGIDPETDTFARYLQAGSYTVCLGSVLGDPVSQYEITLSVADSCTDLGPLTPHPSQDLEADGIADVCDDDDDDDGVADASDNCPAAPNGPQQPFPWSTADEGFVRLWMVLGPFTEGTAPTGCEPSVDSLAGPVDADVAAVLGDTVESIPWFAHFTWPADTPVLRFTDWFDATPAPREAYVMTWVHAPEPRDVELALGADDGLRVWLDGIELGSVAGCQGVYVDAFRFAGTLQKGWNRLLIKVHDGGGGWGLVARFYAADGTTPLTDLDVSLAGPAPWLDDQTDSDTDGIGDLCDPTP